MYHQAGTGLDTVDYISYSTQSTDVSFGRSYDASPNWVFFNDPTPNSSNGTQTRIDELKSTGLQMYPNPYMDRLTIENPTSYSAMITIYSVHGQLLKMVEISPFETINWQDQFKSGLRIVKIETSEATEVIRLINY